MVQKARHEFPKILSLILAVTLILTMLPGGVLTAKAASTLTIQTSNGGTYQTQINGTSTVITLLTNGDYNISGSATDTEIVVQYSVAANITLDNATIYGSNSASPMYPGTPALYITSSLLNPDVPYQARTSQANLTLMGTNKLVGGNARPGIGVPKDGAYLSINGSGSLEADGTDGGAGIGGAALVNSNEDNDCGEVLIYGATVIANGSTGSGGLGGGAGIGGSCYGDGGKVTIKGNSTVTATGGAFAAGIGGGACIRVDEGGTTGIVRHGGDGGSLFVWGSWVKAVGGAGGTGIGGGSSADDDQCAGNGSAVTIYSGTVQALAGGPNNSVYNYGIGAGAASDSGNYGLAGSYTIFGGSVYAKGATSDKNLDAVPTNGSGPVYMTTLRIPNITAPTMVTSCSTYALAGSKTDSSGFLYPYLPAGDESMDISLDGVSRNPAYRYSGTVNTYGSSWLKINPIDQNIFVNNARWDGTGNMSTTFGYNGMPIITTAESANTTFHYTGTDTATSTSYNSDVGPTDYGTYQVQVTSLGDDSFYPILSSYNVKIGISITPKSISGCTLTFNNAHSTYKYGGGSPVNPSFTVSDGGVTLPSYNYTAVYTNNTNIAASTDTNPPTVTLTGKGNYTGSLSGSYTIEKAPGVTVSADPTDWTTGSVTLKAGVTVGSSGIASVTVTKASDSAHPQTLTGGTPLPSGTIEYNYSAVQNDTFTFTVTDGAGYMADSSITVGNIDSANPVVGTVSGNPTAPAQAADLIFPASAASGIKDITVSRETGSNTWEPVIGVTVTKIKNQDGSYTCSYHTLDNGTYRFTVTSGSGLTADTSPVNVTQIDLAQPVVSVSGVSGSKSYTNGDWANQAVELNLSDAVTNLGTATYQYRIVGESIWQTAVNGIVNISAEGTTQLELQATSAAGKASQIVNYTVRLDTIAPVNTAIHFSQNPFKSIAHFVTFGLFFGDTVGVTFTADDGNSGIDHYEYQKVSVGENFDENGNWQTAALSISPDFKGTLYVRAADKAGNVSGYVTKLLVVDKTAPNITANGGVSSLTTIDKNASIPVTVADNGAGIGIITYQINGGSVQTVDLTSELYNDLTKTYNFNIASLPDGNYDVTINAQDNSGNSAQTVVINVNKDAAPKVNDVTVTPGSISLNHGNTQQFHASVSGTNNPSASVKWSVTGNKSDDTTIDATGKLYISSDESAEALTVKAASIANPAKFGQAAITVNSSDQSNFGFSDTILVKTYGDAPFTILAAGGQGSGNVTYAVSGGSDIVSVDTQTGRVTIKKAGSAVITAIKAADGSFNQATAALTIRVDKAIPSVKTLPKSTQLISAGPLSSSTLSGGTASVPGNFVWAKPDTVVKESDSYKVTFLPTDTTDYVTCTCMVPVTVSQQVTDSGTNVTVDLSGCSMPNGVTSVTLSGSSQTPTSGGSAYTVVVKLIGDNQALGSLKKLTVYDLSLLDQNGKPVENFTGKIKVKIPIPEGVSGDLHIFWYNTDKGTLTDMHAVRENNYLVFETSHFSYYAIASFGSSTPPVENPKTGGNGFSPIWWLLAALPVGGTVYGIKRKRYILKKI